MASISWQGFTQFVQNQVAAVQAAAQAVIDATTGSVTLAWAQANTGVALWLQAKAAQVLALTRFATSYGADADSWAADFSYVRPAATYATSTATFGRYTPTVQAVISAGTVTSGVPSGNGALISTGPGGVQFMVYADTTNAAWNATLGAYVIPVSTSSITVPIVATTPGAGSNVLANTVQSFVQGIPYVDYVTNPGAVTNGLNAATDPVFKAGFPLYLASLTSGTELAIEYAIQSVQQGLTYVLLENYDYPGSTPDNGNFFAIINDGSGSPPTSLINAVANAIGTARGFGIRWQVYGPSLVTPTIALSIRVDPAFIAAGGTSTQAKANAQAAIVTGVNATPLGAGTLFISSIEEFALSATGVKAVQPGQTLIAGLNADYSLTLAQLPQIAGSNVTVGTY